MSILPWLSSSILFLVIPLLIFILVPKHKSKPTINLPPSPRKLPIIGNLHQLSRDPHVSLHRLSQTLGPIFLLQLGEIPTVIISSHKTAKQAFKTHDLPFSSRPLLFSVKHLFYDSTDIAFSPYGPYWRRIRKICVLHLLSDKRVQSFSPIRRQQVSRLVTRISEASNPVVDLSSLLALYANDVLCMVALGREFSGGGEYQLHGIQNLLEEYQILLGGFCLGDLFPSLAFLISWVSGMKSRLVKASKRSDKLFDKVIAEHLNSDGTQNLGECNNKDLVDVLLHIHNNGSDDGVSLTMDNVKAVITDMFVGGTDTTFVILDWAMTELITHPNTMKRVQNEIRTIVDNREIVSESDLSDMVYLKAVVKEVLRLHPPAPISVARETIEDVSIDGYDIPAKTRVFVNIWAIGRDPESWKDPEKFEPERFLDSKLNYKGLDFEFIPFGAGRRICPGITMAIVTIELALAQILYSFDWALPSGVEAKDLDMSEVFGITMHKTAHLEVVATPYIASSVSSRL